MAEGFVPSSFASRVTAAGAVGAGFVAAAPLSPAAYGYYPTNGGFAVPGSESPDRRTTTLNLLPAKRVFSPPPAPAAAGSNGKVLEEDKKVAVPTQQAAKAQVVGWPPVGSYRKNTMATSHLKSSKEEPDVKQGQGFLYVKVSMDGAPYLRKVDLKTYKNYKELSLGLEKCLLAY